MTDFGCVQLVFPQDTSLRIVMHRGFSRRAFEYFSRHPQHEVGLPLCTRAGTPHRGPRCQMFPALHD
jgi:hypothetical protein